jgi:hypothetical protein
VRLHIGKAPPFTIASTPVGQCAQIVVAKIIAVPRQVLRAEVEHMFGIEWKS